MTRLYYMLKAQGPLNQCIMLVLQDDALCGLYFAGQRYFPSFVPPIAEAKASHQVVQAVTAYLNAYFSGHRSPLDFQLAPVGTPFQQNVWQALQTIPHGQTVSYQTVAKHIQRPNSVRAVASAIGRNPVSIIIPCHRVIGTDGSLHGYAAGLEVKQALLALEAPYNQCEVSAAI